MTSRQRKYAELCFDAAERAPPEERQDLLDMAKVWLELAVEGQRAMVGEEISLNRWQDITIECNGRVITGTYCVSDWMITVKIDGGGIKSTQLESAPPETLAKLLLDELAQTTR
jgi:hypothetical protein